MTNDETDSTSPKGERALESVDDDRLGFRDLAERIAISLVAPTLKKGMVIGIEGAWGSGKSSLRFLVSEELKNLPKKQRPSIIDFRPWLIGNRDALIAGLFGELSNQFDQIESSAGDKARKASRALRIFRNGLGEAGLALKALGDASGSGKLKLAGEVMKMTGGHSSPRPLSDMKEKLRQSLQDLDHRFIVTIDDVDRLEPKEVIEILRLVRSVADLPNVVYLLCYDRDILAKSIEKATGIESGEAYLAKIVELPVMVPQPESLQLCQWFSDELRKIDSVKNKDEAKRLKQIINYEGGRQLRTPRSVNRVLDAIRFLWPPLRNFGADLPDLVWLQLIKDGNPKLYRWIENYCATAAAFLVGEIREEDIERVQQLHALFNIVPDDYFSEEMYSFHFSKQLTGFYAGRSNKESGVIVYHFRNISEKERHESIKHKRISSPDHYRIYFALNEAPHAFTSDEFASMWIVAGEGVKKTGDALLRFHKEFKTSSRTKTDTLLERMRSGAYETLSEKQCENFLVAFSQVMDEAYWLYPPSYPWRNPLWNEAARLMPLLLSRLKSQRRKPVLSKMFHKGKAISWLTSLFLQETSANDRPPESEWLVPNTKPGSIKKILLERYQAMSPSDVFGCIEPFEILFAWMRVGNEQEPRQFIREHTKADDGFVEALEGLSSSVYSSNQGEFKILKKSYISYFMDYEEVAHRVHNLKNHVDLGQRACRLEEAIKLGAERDR